MKVKEAILRNVYLKQVYVTFAERQALWSQVAIIRQWMVEQHT